MSIGSLVALPVVPYIADGLGRRWGIMIGCVTMILGVILQTISVNLKMFIAARFFLGFGIAIAHGASPLLVTELVHPQHRATFTTIYNTTWYIGSFIAAWLTFGTNHISECHVSCSTTQPCTNACLCRQQLVLACTIIGAGFAFNPADVFCLVRA